MYVFEVETMDGQCTVTMGAKDWNDFSSVSISGQDKAVEILHRLFSDSYGATGHRINLASAAPGDVSVALNLSRSFPSGVFYFTLIEGEQGVLESPPEGAIF